MAPVSRRKDAGRWPRMSSTFWAVVLLTALLILYCGKCCSERGRTRLLETSARRVTLRCGGSSGTTAHQPRFTHRSRSVGVSFLYTRLWAHTHTHHVSSSTACVNVSHCLCDLIRGLDESAVVHLRFYARTLTLLFRGRGWGRGGGLARCQTGLRGETVVHLSSFLLKEGFSVEAIKGRTRKLSLLDETRA